MRHLKFAALLLLIGCGTHTDGVIPRGDMRVVASPKPTPTPKPTPYFVSATVWQGYRLSGTCSEAIGINPQYSKSATLVTVVSTVNQTGKLGIYSDDGCNHAMVAPRVFKAGTTTFSKPSPTGQLWVAFFDKNNVPLADDTLVITAKILPL